MWHQLPPQILEEWAAFSSVCSNDNNFAVYRKLLQTCKAGPSEPLGVAGVTIPCWNIVLSDLFQIELAAPWKVSAGGKTLPASVRPASNPLLGCKNAQISTHSEPRESANDLYIPRSEQEGVNVRKAVQIYTFIHTELLDNWRPIASNKMRQRNSRDHGRKVADEDSTLAELLRHSMSQVMSQSQMARRARYVITDTQPVKRSQLSSLSYVVDLLHLIVCVMCVMVTGLSVARAALFFTIGVCDCLTLGFQQPWIFLLLGLANDPKLASNTTTPLSTHRIDYGCKCVGVRDPKALKFMWYVAIASVCAILTLFQVLTCRAFLRLREKVTN